MRTKTAFLMASILLLTACNTLPTAPSRTDEGMRKSEAMMKKSEGAMMKKDEGMIKGSEAMMKKDEAMVKSEGAMMKKDEGVAKSADAMVKEDEEMMEEEAILEDEEMMEEGVYVAYTDGVIGNGKTSVLFFHAAWCPICKSADAKLKAWYDANSYDRSVYKVDYDTQTTLKNRYGVTYQHTFVLIDGNGNLLKKVQGPTDAQLQALIES